jgi:putative ABC transport system permease protein
MLVILMGVGTGFERGSLQGLGGYAVNSFLLWPDKTTVPYRGLPIGRQLEFTNKDFDKIREKVNGIEDIVPRNRLGGSFSVKYDKTSGSFVVWGDYPAYLWIKSLNVLSGRFINDLDIKEKRKVAVIGTRVRQVLFPDEDPIGKMIEIKGILFMVVGVAEADKGNSMSNRDDPTTIYVPHSAFQQNFNEVNHIDQFVVFVKDGFTADEVIGQMEKIIDIHHIVSPADDRALSYWSAEEIYLKFKSLFAGIRLFIWFVGLGSLMAGIIGVSNIMLIVVKERTKEIGIRKALGSPDMAIIALVIQESVAITLVSGIFGLAAGTSLMEFINSTMKSMHIKNDFFLNPEVRLDVVLISLVLLMVSGAVAGFIPAWRAARVNPIEALRDE